MSEWVIDGSEGLDLFGQTDPPSGAVEARAVAIIVHGFKGYMDYGMFPSIARRLSNEGVIAHRFNLAHSGMTRNTATFERPELFALDTWRHQVEDVMSVVRAVRAGTLDGSGLPLALIGHSRGGVTSLLTAGRYADELRELKAVVTINAPDNCCSMTEAQKDQLLEEGSIESPSARTGQALTIDKRWLQDQLDHPQEHDLPLQVSRIRSRVMVIHGDSDQTVSPVCAMAISSALARTTEPILVPGGDHVLNTPNPWPPEGLPPPQLGEALDWLASFLREIGPSEGR